MSRARSVAVLLAVVAAASALFWLALHQVSGVWLDVALHPEVRRALERSMEDQKTLRRLDPPRREAYRRRFDETRMLLGRMEVLRLNRERMMQRFELALLATFGIAAAMAAALLWTRYRRAHQQERAAYLARVSSLQETARRHAHEIKGPLTAARLELERLGDLARSGAPVDEISRVEESVHEELERLGRYTRAVSSFAGLGRPVLRRESLGEIVQELCSTFATAWKGMDLHDEGGDAIVCIDRDLFRQILVNLCSNSASAGARRVTFSIAEGPVHLNVRDDGTGVPDSLRDRIFDPYVTTRGVGEGMGLGLPISRKIMLEHGGDLALVESSEKGTVFRVTFGELACS